MKISREVKTAIIAILVLALTIWGFNFLKGKNIISPTDVFYVEYEQIEGLIESGTVFYKGYKVGSINEIVFNGDEPNKFIVKIVLEKDIKIPLKTSVMAKETNLIAGSKDLQLLFYDTNAYHQPGDTLLPAYDKGLMGILEPLQDQLDETVIGINKSLLALNNILSEETQSDIQKSVKSLRRLSANFAKMSSTNGSLTKTMDNLEAVSSSFEAKKEDMESAIEHFSNISASLDSSDLAKTIELLDSTLLATSEIMRKINTGEGTMGLLMNDSALYNNLAASTASLDSLLIDLKEHPKRYVHFSMFGKKDK